MREDAGSSADTSTPSSTTGAWFKTRRPVLSSVRPRLMPGLSPGTTKVPEPLRPMLGSTQAKTMYALAMPPFDTKSDLAPVSTKRSSFFTARVWWWTLASS